MQEACFLSLGAAWSSLGTAMGSSGTAGGSPGAAGSCPGAAKKFWRTEKSLEAGDVLHSCPLSSLTAAYTLRSPSTAKAAATRSSKKLWVGRSEGLWEVAVGGQKWRAMRSPGAAVGGQKWRAMRSRGAAVAAPSPDAQGWWRARPPA